jgi:hypothetical protein
MSRYVVAISVEIVAFCDAMSPPCRVIFQLLQNVLESNQRDGLRIFRRLDIVLVDEVGVHGAPEDEATGRRTDRERNAYDKRAFPGLVNPETHVPGNGRRSQQLCESVYDLFHGIDRCRSPPRRPFR